jgi:hypothetical protein
MTKEQAIFQLQAFINAKSRGFYGEHIDFKLPIKDEIVCVIIKEDYREDWTFKGLIKLIYDIK